MSINEPIVYLVDDEPGVLKAVARILKASGWRTATYESPWDFLRAHDPNRIGCVILDLAMPSLNGLEIQRVLGEVRSGMHPRPVIFLTGRAEVPDSVEAMKRGAVDFLTKPVDDTDLLEAVERAVRLDTVAHQNREKSQDLETRLATLTPRERQVMVEVVSGKLNKQVAMSLGITEKTVKVHRARVMEKMGAQSLADLVRLADSVLSID